MVMTVLEARVAPERAAELERTFEEAAAALPSGIVETFLVRSSREPSTFRIVTLWSSRAALDAMRASGETPKGVQIFQSVGAGPELSVFDVVTHGSR
jgi:heme-degrading monooxygenase HmoA